jgi:hypothetical protein
MNSNDPRTVTAVVKRERARNRLRAVTAGTGVLGLAVAGGLAFTLPGSTHSASGASGTSSKSTSGSSSTHATSGGSGTSSSSSGTSGSSSSAPSSSSGSAQATSGGS